MFVDPLLVEPDDPALLALLLECDSHAMMNSPPSTQCLSRTGASREPYRTVSGGGTGEERGVERELHEQLTLFLLFASFRHSTI